MYRRSLRSRIQLCFLLAGVLLAALFAIGTWWTAEFMERQFLEATLREELEYFVASHQRDPRTSPPATTSVRGWVVPQNDDSRLPPYLRDLEPGIHEIGIRGRSHEIAVADVGGFRYLLAYDESRIDIIERWLVGFLVAGCLSLVCLSVWLGLFLSRRITSPVAELVRRVESLGPDPSEGAVAGQFQADDELRALAWAFDEYREKVRDLLAREKHFTADASHQLRTWISVISSTLELVREDSSLSASTRGRLERLERASGDMARQIQAFLLLAREPEPGEEGCSSVAGVVREVVERERGLAGRDHGMVETTIESDLGVAASTAAVDIVVGNLVHNALVHGAEPVRIRLAGDELTVTDGGGRISPEEIPRLFERGFRGSSGNGGSGLGLAIAQRVCTRYGWFLALDSDPGRSTTARVRFRGQELAPAISRSSSSARASASRSPMAISSAR